MKGLITALLTAVAWPAHAANIQVTGQTVTISGDLGLTDFETFQAKTSSLNTATVVLKSIGGRALASTVAACHVPPFGVGISSGADSPR